MRLRRTVLLSLLVVACLGALGATSAFAYSGWSNPRSLYNIGELPGRTSVSCASAGLCVAVNNFEYKKGTAEIYKEGKWGAPVNIDSGANGYEAVSCAPMSSFCVAVDVTGSALTYNGSFWSSPSATILPNADGEFQSISCPSTSFCAAVTSGGYALTYNGGVWSAPVNIAGEKDINTVSCASASFCVAGDSYGEVLTYNGSSWSAPTSIGSSESINSISCTGTSFCAAVDSDGSGFIYNGSSWSVTPNIGGPAGGLFSVSCTNPNERICVAVGALGEAVTYNDSVWLKPRNIELNTLTSVSCPNESFCVAVDVLGDVLMYPGAAGESSQPPPATLGETADLFPVSGALSVRLPGEEAFLPLENPEVAPLGTLVNARSGVVSVVTETPGGGSQAVSFSKGEFKISQTIKGAATATLAGGSFSSCPRRGSGKVIRELSAEGRGSYSVTGTYASSSPSGTAHWLTQDRCGSTIVRVTSGKVVVTNRSNKRRVTIGKGRSYVVKGRVAARRTPAQQKEFERHVRELGES